MEETFSGLGGASIYDWGAGCTSTAPFGNVGNLVTSQTAYLGVSVTGDDSITFATAGDYVLSLSSNENSATSWGSSYTPTYSTTGGVSARLSRFQLNKATTAEFANSFLFYVHVTASGTFHITNVDPGGGAITQSYVVIWDIRENPWAKNLYP